MNLYDFIFNNGCFTISLQNSWKVNNLLRYKSAPAHSTHVSDMVDVLHSDFLWEKTHSRLWGVYFVKSLKGLPQFSSQGHAHLGVGPHKWLSNNGTSPAISVQCRALLIGACCSWVPHSPAPAGLTETLTGLTFWHLPPALPASTRSFHRCYTHWTSYIPNSVSLSVSQEIQPNKALKSEGKQLHVLSENGYLNKWKWPKRTESWRKWWHPLGETWLDPFMSTRELTAHNRVSKRFGKELGNLRKQGWEMS